MRDNHVDNGKVGSTPLHLAAMKGHMESVSCLMDHGADEDAVDNAGLTPYVLLIHSTPFSKVIHLIRFIQEHWQVCLVIGIALPLLYYFAWHR